MAEKMRVRKTKLTLIALLSFAFLFTGCARRYEGIIGILDGVLSWSRQNWARSASSFLETAERATAADDPRLREYAVYGLASTYLAQDEHDSALLRLAEIGDAGSPEVRAGVWYQAGVIAYRRGDYDEAASSFRKSLESDSVALDAKINLELSLLSLVKSRSDRASASPGIQEETGPGQESETIFNLIRKKEQDRWKNQVDETAHPAVADY